MELVTKTAHVHLLKEGFVKMVMSENAFLELEDMQENHRAENLVAGGKPHVILIDTRLNSLSSDAARKFTSGEEPTKYRYATAILFNGLAGRIVANSLVKKYSPKVLTEIFEDEAAAIEWLEQILKANTGVTARIYPSK